MELIKLHTYQIVSKFMWFSYFVSMFVYAIIVLCTKHFNIQHKLKHWHAPRTYTGPHGCSPPAYFYAITSMLYSVLLYLYELLIFHLLRIFYPSRSTSIAVPMSIDIIKFSILNKLDIELIVKMYVYKWFATSNRKTFNFFNSQMQCPKWLNAHTNENNTVIKQTAKPNWRKTKKKIVYVKRNEESGGERWMNKNEKFHVAVSDIVVNPSTNHMRLKSQHLYRLFCLCPEWILTFY